MCGALGVDGDLLEDFEGPLFGVLVDLGGVLEPQPIMLCVAVAGEEQHRARVGGLDREHQVQEDERERVPASIEEAEDIGEYPGDDDHAPAR